MLQPSAQDAGLALVDATDMHSASEAINGSVPDATVVKKAGYDKYIYIYYIIYLCINTIKCDVPPKKDRQKAAEIVKRHSSILFGVTMHCVFYMYILYMCVCVPYLYVN